MKIFLFVRLISVSSESIVVHLEQQEKKPKFQSDAFLRIAMSILPITAVISYQIDAIWQWKFRNMYAGLSSTILHIFYFLQFYTHLKCRSKTITLIYTYSYHIVIWMFKVTFSNRKNLDDSFD